jgi:hypothetical protein
MPKDPYKDISEQADQERINSAILAGEVVKLSRQLENF